MIAKFQIWLGLAGAVAVAVTLAFLKGQSTGRAIEQVKAAKKEREDIQAVTETRANTKSKSDTELNEEVDTWTRDSSL